MTVATNPPFSIKKGDRGRPIKYQLVDGNNNPVDISSASGVTFRMTQNTPTSPKQVSGAATIVTAATGIVQYAWAALDTDTVGSYRGEWVVTWPGSLPDTFPSDGYVDIEVYATVA